MFKIKKDTEKLKLLRGQYFTGVTFCHVELAHFYENENYSSGKSVIILRRNPRSLFYGGHFSALHRPYIKLSFFNI